MEIKVQLFGRVFSICLGRDTKWFSQIYFLTIAEEFFEDDFTVSYARMIFKSN